MWNSKTECQTTERQLKLNGPTRKIETQHKHNTHPVCLNKILQYRHIFTSPHRPIHPPTLRSRECLCSKLVGSRGGNWRKPRAWRQTISRAATGSDATFSWVRFKDPGDRRWLWIMGYSWKKQEISYYVFLLQGHPTDFPPKCLNVFLHLW